MTEKELREIKRRFRPEKSNIPRIVGCFVNHNKEIIAKISQPLGITDDVVSEKLLGIMKKTLSGSLGTNLCDIAFSTKQVTHSEEHKLLMSLRECELRDSAVLDRFYARVIDSLTFEGNYVILLANDIYDVFSRTSDGEQGDSTERFSYIVCAVCPVKNAPEALTFREADSLFHTVSPSALLSAPELGFMFPAFDDRAANIYNALYYTRSISECYEEFTKNVFGVTAPMPAKMQKATFNDCLSEALSEECTLEVIRSVHEQFAEIMQAHKESRDPEPLTVTKATVGSVLAGCGIDAEKIEKIGAALDESFGTGAELSPKNVVSANKYELTLPDVTVKVDPAHRDLVTTQVIGGVKYLMIRVTGGVELNGIHINMDEE